MLVLLQGAVPSLQGAVASARSSYWTASLLLASFDAVLLVLATHCSPGCVGKEMAVRGDPAEGLGGKGLRLQSCLSTRDVSHASFSQCPGLQLGT